MRVFPRNPEWQIRIVGASIAVMAALLGFADAARATDYSEVSIVSASYVDIDGNTYTSYQETADLSSNAAAPTNIGALTLGSNVITGATFPYGPVANPATGELVNQDNDYVTFTVPTGDKLTNIFLVAPPAEVEAADVAGSTVPVLDGSAIVPGDLFFVGIASGSSVSVTEPSSTGLLGFTLLSSSAVGSDILPDLGSLAAPPPFNAPPFLGATTFTGALPAGTYTLWLLDGNQPVSYKLDLNVAAVPELTSWAMYIAGFGLVGYAMRRKRSVTVSFA